MKKKFPRLKNGETLIEVILANAIFSLIAISVIGIMNHGLQFAQNSLEMTMARSEIDAQAESLRFIHDAYSSEKDSQDSIYTDLWKEITEKAYSPSDLAEKYPNFSTNYIGGEVSCEQMYDLSDSGAGVILKDSFIINTHAIGIGQDSTVSTVSNKLSAPTMFPRLIFGSMNDNILSDAYYDSSSGKIVRRHDDDLYAAEGIWVTAVRSRGGQQCTNSDKDVIFYPDYYDFYIRSCWENISKSNSNAIGTTIRLSNPSTVYNSKTSVVTFDDLEWEKYDNIPDHTYCSSAYGRAGYQCTEDPENTTVISGTTISFSGYNISAMDEGVRYTIGADEGFTINAHINTQEIQPHPGGQLTISIGKLTASINNTGGVFCFGTPYCTDGIARVGSNFDMSMSRYADGTYGLAIDGKEINLGDQSGATQEEVTIDFNFSHDSHNCYLISKARISNIEMIYTNAGGEDGTDCERVEQP